MCRPAYIALCQFCKQPLPPVTMAHTAAGIAPLHVCQPTMNAAAACTVGFGFSPYEITIGVPAGLSAVPPIHWP